MAPKDAAGEDCVDPDVVFDRVSREIACEADQCGLDCRVGDRLDWLLIFRKAFFAKEALVRRDDTEAGGNIQDDARNALNPLLAKDARAEESAGQAD